MNMHRPVILFLICTLPMIGDRCDRCRSASSHFHKSKGERRWAYKTACDSIQGSGATPVPKVDESCACADRDGLQGTLG
jgi:hypothetical protein